MRAEIHDGYTSILLTDKEIKELCRPGASADTCIWLAVGVDGFECLYYNRGGTSLAGGTLEKRWKQGLTVAKRDGCDKVRSSKPVPRGTIVEF